MKSYGEKLKDPRWQKKRLEVLERDGWGCYECKDKESTLNVHHLVYESHDPWDTQNYLLRVLCNDCHKDYPKIIKESMGDLLGFEDITLDEFNIIYGHTFSLLYKIIGKEGCIALYEMFFDSTNANTEPEEMKAVLVNFFEKFINHYNRQDCLR